MQVKGKLALNPAATSPVQPQGVALSPIEYTGFVAADFRGDTHFEEFALGCRILNLDKFVMHNVPKRWRLPATEWEEAEEGLQSGTEDPVSADPLAAAALTEGLFREV